LDCPFFFFFFFFFVSPLPSHSEPDGTFLTRSGRPGSAGSFTHEQAPRGIDPFRGGGSRGSARGGSTSRQGDAEMEPEAAAASARAGDGSDDSDMARSPGAPGGPPYAAGDPPYAATSFGAAPMLDFELRGSTPPASARSEVSERMAQADTDRLVVLTVVVALRALRLSGACVCVCVCVCYVLKFRASCSAGARKKKKKMFFFLNSI
jgi:hypothetical protein